MGLEEFRKTILKAKKISCDANCFIYFFEAHEKFGPLTKEIFKALKEKRIEIVSSTILLTELLVSPFKDEEKHLISLYSSLGKEVNFIAPSLEIAIQAANLRANYDIKAPDAIHLATGISSGAKLFITNDKKLRKIKEIKTIILKDLV